MQRLFHDACITVSEPAGMNNLQFTEQSVSCLVIRMVHCPLRLQENSTNIHGQMDKPQQQLLALAGTHYLTVTDANGCSVTDSSIVSTPPVISVSEFVGR